MERTWNELGGGIQTGKWEMGNGKWEKGKRKWEMESRERGALKKSGVWSCGFRPPAAAWSFFLSLVFWQTFLKQ